MAKIINCDCGVTLRGETDDELVAAGQQHAKEVHGIDLSAEQLLAMAQIA